MAEVHIPQIREGGIVRITSGEAPRYARLFHMQDGTPIVREEIRENGARIIYDATMLSGDTTIERPNIFTRIIVGRTRSFS